MADSTGPASDRMYDVPSDEILEVCLAALKNQKAPGPDGIPVEAYKSSLGAKRGPVRTGEERVEAGGGTEVGQNNFILSWVDSVLQRFKLKKPNRVCILRWYMALVGAWV